MTTQSSLSRRAMLGRIPLAALATTAVFPIETIAEPVSEVEKEFREYQRLSDLTSDVWEVKWEAEQRYDEPSRPGYRLGLEFGSYIVINNLLYCDCGDENITFIRERIALYERDPDDGCGGAWNRKELKRAKATLEKIETYLSERKRRQDESGLTKAVQDLAAATAIEEAQRDKFNEMPVSNIRDLAFKAALVRDYEWDEDIAGNILWRLVELTGIAV